MRCFLWTRDYGLECRSTTKSERGTFRYAAVGAVRLEGNLPCFPLEGGDIHGPARTARVVYNSCKLSVDQVMFAYSARTNSACSTSFV